MVKNKFLLVCSHVFGSLFLFFLCSASVSAVGYNVLHIDDCFDKVFVKLDNSSLSVDSGEYNFIGCSLDNVTWSCVCSGDYDLVLETQVNAFNSYVFRIDYVTESLVKHSGSVGFMSGGGRINHANGSVVNLINDSLVVLNRSIVLSDDLVVLDKDVYLNGSVFISDNVTVINSSCGGDGVCQVVNATFTPVNVVEQNIYIRAWQSILRFFDWLMFWRRIEYG